MIRSFSLRRGLAAALAVFAVLLALGCAGALAEEAGDDALLRIDVSVRPEGLIEPGDVMLSFAIENISEEDARNVYLSSADGLVFELVGQIAPGEIRSFSRQHSVSAEELDAGEILYTVSHNDPVDANRKINYSVRAPIHRSDALPAVEFTRQFSSRSIEPGGTVTITYRVRNTGNVPLSELQVQDSLGNFTGRVEQLETGESRTLINRVPVTEDVVSSAKLSYRADDGEAQTEALADVTVRAAAAQLDSQFTADYSAFSRSAASVTLTLTNSGDMDYRDIRVIDDIYGGVIADELTLPAGSAPLEVSRTYAVRGELGFRWRVTGASASGAPLDFVTDTVGLPEREAGSPGALRLRVEALTPRIRRAGEVTLRAQIDNDGGVDLNDLALSEANLGDVLSFVTLPADGSITRDFTVHVSDDASYAFSLRGSDAAGEPVTVSAAPVEIAIASDGALPNGERERFFEFTGGSIKIGGSSTFAVLLLAGCAVLLGLIVALIIATHRARVERQLKAAAERQRRREELSKTNRFTPVRAPQKSKGKGRNR